jgi:hypothetical protein
MRRDNDFDSDNFLHFAELLGDNAKTYNNVALSL